MERVESEDDLVPLKNPYASSDGADTLLNTSYGIHAYGAYGYGGSGDGLDVERTLASNAIVEDTTAALARGRLVDLIERGDIDALRGLVGEARLRVQRPSGGESPALAAVAKPDPAASPSPSPSPSPLCTTPVIAHSSASSAPLLMRRRTDSTVALPEESLFCTDWYRRLEWCYVTEGTEKVLDVHRLHQVCRDFNATAKLYGSVIVNERGMPIEHRSIKPVGLGGVAGGTKYIAGGIIFKFAEDVQLFNGTYLYGGAEACDVAAQKAAGHERKGVQLILQKALTGIRAPLMTLVDYRGWRLSAQSLLPISKDSLVYGSADGGVSIEAAENAPCVAEALQRLASQLHLAEHRVVDGAGTVKSVCMPVDIEVHRTGDGMMFVIDTARLMPPMPPPPKNRRAIFYRMFRPEFLAAHKTFLSSDAMSAFGLLDKEQHNTNAELAYEALMHHTIPNVARRLTASDASSHSITRVLQQRGINVRFLGVVRGYVTDETVRAVLLREMVARVVQKRLRHVWRTERRFSTLPLLHLTVALLNELRAATPPAWVREAVLSKFGAESLANEPGPLPVVESLARACELAGVTVSNTSADSRLTISDVSIEARTKVLSVSTLAEAEGLALEAKSASRQRSLELLAAATRIVLGELISDPENVALQLMLTRLRLSIAKRHHSAVADGVDGTAWAQASSDFQESWKSLSAQLNDAKYLHCRFMQLLCETAALVLDAASAVTYWAQAVQLLGTCDTASQWMAFAEPQPAAARVQRRRAKLAAVAVRIVRSISSPIHIDLVCSTLEPHLAWVPLAQAMAALPADYCSADLAALLAVAMRLAPRSEALALAARVWLASKTQLDLSRLTLGPLGDATMAGVSEWLLASGADVALAALHLRNGAFGDAAMLGLCAARPSLVALEVDNCNVISGAGLQGALATLSASLQRLTLRRVSCVRGHLGQWVAALPSALRELQIDECVGLTANAVPALPVGLESFSLLHSDVVPSLELMTRLQALERLRELHVESLPAALACFVNSRVESLALPATDATGLELPPLPSLRELLDLGANITNDGLERISATTPHLHTLHLTGCVKLESAALAAALAYWPSLTDFAVPDCANLDDSCLALMAPALLRRTKTTNVWALTSRQLAPHLSPQVESVHFHSPRDPLLLALGSHVTSLHLAHTATVSPQGWAAVCAVAGSLRDLRIENIGGIDDDRMAALLMPAVQLESLQLANMALAEGSGLARAACAGSLSRLKSLRLHGGMTDQKSFSTTLYHCVELEALDVNTSGESDDMFRVLALRCRKLRRLTLYSSTATHMSDRGLWLPRCAALEEFEISWAVLASLPLLYQLGRLRKVTLVHMRELAPDVVKQFADMSLVRLVLRRSSSTSELLAPLLRASRTLREVHFTVTDAHSGGAAVMVDAVRHASATLAFASIVSLDGISVLPAGESGLPRALREDAASTDDESTATTWLSDPALAVSVRRQLTHSLPPIEFRTKWAFMVYMHDYFSFEAVTLLVPMGYRVIIALPTTEQPDGVYSNLKQYLSAEDGVHWLSLDTDEPERFQDAVRATGCPALDLAFLLWPVAHSPDGKRILKPTMEIANLATFRTYMTAPFDYHLYKPALLYVMLLPWLRAATAPRVVFHVSALGSISTTRSAQVHSSRMMHAAAYSFLRVVSLELPHAIVIGAHVGLWMPGVRATDKLVAGITAVEALRRMWGIATQVQTKHSGFIVDHTLKCVPP